MIADGTGFDASGWLRQLFGGDPTAAIERLHDDVEWIVPGAPELGGGVHAGRDAVLRFFARVLALFPAGLAIEAAREWPALDGAVVEAVLTGTTATGHPYRNHYAFVVEADAARVRRVREYTDTALAESLLRFGMQQAGRNAGTPHS